MRKLHLQDALMASRLAQLVAKELLHLGLQ